MGSINRQSSIRNIGRAAGLLYLFIDLLSYIPADSSQTATAWLATGSVLEGLVTRVEVLGGLWILLVTWGALRAGELPRALNHLGLAVGVAGVLTVVPALEVLGVGFRLGEMVWAVWLGIVMFRGSRSAAARNCRAFFAVRFGMRGAATHDLAPTRGES